MNVVVYVYRQLFVKLYRTGYRLGWLDNIFIFFNNFVFIKMSIKIQLINSILCQMFLNRFLTFIMYLSKKIYIFVCQFYFMVLIRLMSLLNSSLKYENQNTFNSIYCLDADCDIYTKFVLNTSSNNDLCTEL